MRLLSTFVLLLTALLCRAEGVAEVRVLVLPMELAGPASANWLPDALRQNIVHELARSSRLVALSPKDATATGDALAAREAGQKLGAHLVIFGACQMIDNDVRLMGHVLDVKSGRVTGVTKLTGSMRDVFGMEDQFAAKCKQLSLEAIGEQQAKADPVAVFAKNMDRPVAAVKPQDPMARTVYPWDQFDPELQWARDNMTYGRRTSTDYYSYPTYPWGVYYGVAYGAWGGPVYGYGWGLRSGWIGHPMNVSNNANINTIGRSYTSGTSIQWGGNYSCSKGHLQFNVGR